MDLTTWSTAMATPISHSDPYIPPPQDSSCYHLPQPQPFPIPNPNHLRPTSEPYAYYAAPANPPQPQPHYYHYQQPTEPVPASYYQGPSWQYTYSQITSHVLHQLQNLPGVVLPPNLVHQFAAAIPNDTAILPSQAKELQSNGSGKKKKKVSKKTKVVQSASCDICKIVCTSKDVLEQHKLGKKHLKNASKMVKLDTSVAVTSTPMIGPVQSNGKIKKVAVRKLKRPASSQGDLETKRMKVVAEGASAAAVRVCAACNVVCNSEKVFNSHIAGHKHAAAMKKDLASTA